MLVALRGITWAIIGGQAVFAFHPALFAIVNQAVFGLPLFFLLAIVLTLVMTAIVTKTRFGRHVRAVGGDELAAARAGISVKRVRTVALLLSAFGAGSGRHHPRRPAGQRGACHRASVSSSRSMRR